MKSKIITSGIAVLTLLLTASATTVFIASNSDSKVPVISDRAKSLAALTRTLEYDFDRPAIRNNYYSNLDQLAKEIKSSNYAISLRGHADSIGKYKYNWVLSDKRAINVKKYLVSKGIKAERIITTPFGSTVPIASNKTEAGRQKNRRVEIELKAIDLRQQ
ncbi:OmpA family protein [Pedobacter heparinus]|uniref:OmpA family protein n=1 Tax=Pedobacter heparinus TaxID=984 RepID=UPI00292E7379|nr:OmpA family protein [Pedobacter heparinus]